MFAVKSSIKKKRIQDEKYVCQAINYQLCFIKIDPFQGIVGNICQDVLRFNLRYVISFLPTRRTSTYCFFRNKMLLLLLLLTGVNIIVQKKIVFA